MVDARGQSAHSGDGVPEVPGYRIERQLGRGSMGVVYLAEDVQLRRKVALKILSPTMSDDELFRKRFDRESQSAAKLDHPSIVPVYAAGEAGGLLYIAMRYVSGGDVRARLDAGGPLDLAQVSSLVASVADALDAAHALGIIHRDVKPANILIDKRNDQEHYYLSDFGITKIISAGRSLTTAGQIIGTIDYIAPEQIQGKAVDGRADLYALGCVLYECLTAEVPFPRDETTAAMWAHVHDETPSVTARRPDLPPQIDHIVAKAMAKQPEDRYATCRELAVALRAAAGPAAAGEPYPVAPAGPIETPPAPPPVSSSMTSTYTPPTPAPAQEPATSSARRWSWWWIAAASVVALALLGGGTVAVMKYVSSRYPTVAERALLSQAVPDSLEDGCDRNSEISEADAADVLASVTCTSGGDQPKTTVFTKFKSAQDLDSHYRTYVQASPVTPNSGNYLNTDRAEKDYNSPDGTSGRVVCYQKLNSSYVAWTDGRSLTFVEAKRVDGDYPKLRNWWAGVVSQPTGAVTEERAKNEAAIKAADKAREDAQREATETKNQKAAEDAKRAEADNKKAEAQAREAAKKSLEDEAKAAQDLKEKAENDRNQAKEKNEETERLNRETEGEKTRAAELKNQPPAGDQASPQNLDDGQQVPSPTRQQPPSAPTQLSTSQVTLSGPAPAAPAQAQGRQAPGRQRGGSAVAGSGGCVPTSDGYHLCALVQPAPGYQPGTTNPNTVLQNGESAFVCQSAGSAYSVGNRDNQWWAWVGDGNRGVWVPTAFLAGAPDNAPVSGLPICGSTSAPNGTTNPNGTTEGPNTPNGPSIIIEVPAPQPRDNTEDDPPTFRFPF